MSKHGLLHHKDVTAVVNPTKSDLEGDYSFAGTDADEDIDVLFQAEGAIGEERGYLDGINVEQIEDNTNELYNTLESDNDERTEISLTGDGVYAMRIGGGGATVVKGDISKLEDLGIQLVDTEGADSSYFGREAGYLTTGQGSIRLFEGEKDLGTYTAEEVAGYLKHQKAVNDESRPYMTGKLEHLLEYLNQSTSVEVHPNYEILGPELEEEDIDSDEHHVQTSLRDAYAPSFPLAFDLSAGVIEAYESPVSRLLGDASEENIWARFKEDNLQAGVPVVDDLGNITHNAVRSQVANAREDAESPFSGRETEFVSYPLHLVDDASVAFDVELPAGREQWTANTFVTEPENGTVENIWAFETSVDNIKEAFK